MHKCIIQILEGRTGTKVICCLKSIKIYAVLGLTMVNILILLPKIASQIQIVALAFQACCGQLCIVIDS